MVGWMLENWKSPLMMSLEEHRWACSYISAEFQKNIGCFLGVISKDT